MSRISLEAFIDSYGKALSAGESEQIADSWEVPSLVLSDQGTTMVTTKGEVMAFFEKASLDIPIAAAVTPSGDVFTALSGLISGVGEIVELP